MLRAHLRAPGGVALVAAKRYYFGTGGGVAAFKSQVAACAPRAAPAAEASGRCGGEPPPQLRLRAHTVWVAEDRQSNIREIVRVVWEGEGEGARQPG